MSEETIYARHLCHARGCNKAVPPRMLMCLSHWRMVPRWIQSMVWATYRPGQEVDKRPSEQYLQAMNAAIDAVAVAEGTHGPTQSMLELGK